MTPDRLVMECSMCRDASDRTSGAERRDVEVVDSAAVRRRRGSSADKFGAQRRRPRGHSYLTWREESSHQSVIGVLETEDMAQLVEQHGEEIHLGCLRRLGR